MVNEELNKLDEQISKAKDNILFWQSYLLQLEKDKEEKLQIIKDNKEIIEHNAILSRQVFKINKDRGIRTDDAMIERARHYLEEEEIEKLLAEEQEALERQEKNKQKEKEKDNQK